ncbi:MAG: LysE family translocator [Pseudomonadota bacterium]
MSVSTTEFLIFAASQVATPGPANMALMSTGARFGFANAMPFVAGVVLGKQLVIWPMGFGLLELADRAPGVFFALKWISAAYILWLAWRIAGTRLITGASDQPAPGFGAGLWVHPLNPKAWAMIAAGFTAFTQPGTPALEATLVIAICLFGAQIVLHPIWALGGDRIASRLAGRPGERLLMGTLAALTVASVLLVLWGGENP